MAASVVEPGLLTGTKGNGGGLTSCYCDVILVITASTAILGEVLREQHGEHCSRDAALDVMIVVLGGIQALSDQRFAELIPCARMDMLAAYLIEVAHVTRQAVCAFPQPKR